MLRLQTILAWIGGGLVLGSAAWINARYHLGLRAAQAWLAASRRMIETAFGAIEYGESGAGEPVLVMHGAAVGFDQGLTLGEVTIKYGLNTARSFPGDESASLETGGHFLAGHCRELRGLVNRFLAGETVAGPLEES